MKILTLTQQLKHYSFTDFKLDLLGSIVLCVVLIPQCMAYAMLAGLPPQIGLYASIIPLIIYAFIGGSRFISMGPTAIISLLLFSTVGNLNVSTEAFIAISGGIAVYSGLIYIIAGIMNLKFLDYILSETVLKGFCMAAAIIIASSQLKTLLDIDVPLSNNFLHHLSNIAPYISKTKTLSAIIGLTSIFLLITMQLISDKIPGGLIILILGISVSYFFDLDHKGVTLVGEVPRNLPSFTMPSFDLAHFEKISQSALLIFFIGFLAHESPHLFRS